MQIRITSDSSIHVGIPEDPVQQVRIWPNPATIRITMASEQPFDHIAITDLSGRVRFERDDSILQQTVDVAKWPDGLYLVQWENANGVTETRKLLKVSR